VAFALGTGLLGHHPKMKIHFWKPFRAIMSSPCRPVAFSQLCRAPLPQAVPWPPQPDPKRRGNHATLLGPPPHHQRYSCRECYLQHPTLGCTSACIYRAVGGVGKGLRAKKKNLISSCYRWGEAVRQEPGRAARGRGCA